MKKLNLLTLIVLITGLILTSVFCKRLDLERITKVKIGEITEQTNNTATISAEVFDVSESASRRGICYGTEANPEVTANVIWQEQAPLIGTYSTQITNIDAGTYYVRAVAEDNTGFVYSNKELNFTIGDQTYEITAPISSTILETGGTYNITWNSNTEGSVNIILMKSSTVQNPIIADSISNSGQHLWAIPTGLEEGNDYTIIIQEAGNTTNYAESEAFTINAATGTTGTLNDVDNNSYNTIKIGNQWWMAENLKVTRYFDGSQIGVGEITNNTVWANLNDDNDDKAYCYYSNNIENEKDTYGALYTYAAATNGDNDGTTQGICPTGWHLPSDVEWTELKTYLSNNGYGYEGSGDDIGKSMAATSNWENNNTEGNVGNEIGTNNSSGFTGLPSGLRSDNNGIFSNILFNVYWWSSTEEDGERAHYYRLAHDKSNAEEGDAEKSRGISVRCVKNE